MVKHILLASALSLFSNAAYSLELVDQLCKKSDELTFLIVGGLLVVRDREEVTISEVCVWEEHDNAPFPMAFCKIRYYHRDDTFIDIHAILTLDQNGLVERLGFLSHADENGPRNLSVNWERTDKCAMIQ